MITRAQPYSIPLPRVKTKSNEAGPGRQEFAIRKATAIGQRRKINSIVICERTGRNIYTRAQVQTDNGNRQRQFRETCLRPPRLEFEKARSQPTHSDKDGENILRTGLIRRVFQGKHMSNAHPRGLPNQSDLNNE